VKNGGNNFIEYDIVSHDRKVTTAIVLAAMKCIYKVVVISGDAFNPGDSATLYLSGKCLLDEPA
jgi:hypothetical protein